MPRMKIRHRQARTHRRRAAAAAESSSSLPLLPPPCADETDDATDRRRSRFPSPSPSFSPFFFFPASSMARAGAELMYRQCRVWILTPAPEMETMPGRN